MILVFQPISASSILLFSKLRYFGNNANDNYNSFQAKVRKTFNRGYSLLAHYTWSKGLDYDENYFTSDPPQATAPPRFDVRHRFVMTNIWELPIGRGKAWLGGIGPAADRFIGGWTISAITIWQKRISVHSNLSSKLIVPTTLTSVIQMPSGSCWDRSHFR